MLYIHLSVVRLAAAVHETLNPFLTEVREDLAALKRESKIAITDLREDLAAIRKEMNMTTVKIETTEVREGLAALKTDILEDMVAVKENLTILIEGKVDALSRDLKEHKNKATTEMVDMGSKLDSLDSKQDGLRMTVMTVNSELEHNVLTNVTKELKKTADYVLEELPPYECGGTGDWRRVVYLDMKDPNSQCPTGWQLTSHSKRTCGKVNTSSLSCDSVFFPVSGGNYASVCGSIRAYQYVGVDGFEAYHDGRVTTIEGAYVSGVSLTHGSPRQHIWTFAAGYSEHLPTRNDVCPCDASINITIPPFVAGDYFCESGASSEYPNFNTIYSDDPLWDGEGCSSSSSCCSFNNPPYFTKQLTRPTSDPIEARLCRWESSEGDDSPVELVELYVK